MYYTKEQNLAAFKKLPTAVREFFMSEDTIVDIDEVVRTNSLSPEQRNKLADITNEFILGFSTPEECERKLITELSLSGDRAEGVKKYLKNKVVEKVNYLRTLPDDEATEEQGGEVDGANDGVDAQSVGVSVEKSVISGALSSISKKYKLTVEQEAGIEKEINKILSGETKLTAFRSNIVSLYKVTYDQALKIAYDVNEQIFSKTNSSAAGNASENIPEKQVTPPTPPAVSSPPKNISPDHMIPDHRAMEITDGPHLHSQNIMPQDGGGDQGGFGTIIDRKLSRIVKNRTESAQVTQSRNEKYKGSDPYREPIE